MCGQVKLFERLMNLMIDHTYTYIFIPHTYKCIDWTLFCIKVCDGLSLAQLFLHKGLANAYEQKAPFILLNIILFRDSLFLMSPMCLLFRFFLSHTHTHTHTYPFDTAFTTEIKCHLHPLSWYDNRYIL